MNIIEKIKERAKQNKKTIVLPETMDRRVLEAAETALKEEIANIILIGKEEEIHSLSQGLNLSSATIINPYTSTLTPYLTEELYNLRKEKGLSQDDLAKAVGLTHTAIGLWEQGKRVPNLDSVIALSNFFGVSLDYIAGLED